MFGMDLANLGTYLKEDEAVRAKMDQMTKGIPTDSLKNELAEWIQEGYEAFMIDAQNKGISVEDLRDDEGLRYAIKADGATQYEKIEKVIDIFREKNIFQFNMVTTLEAGVDISAESE
jgi:biopolymer transport protein ExbD